MINFKYTLHLIDLIHILLNSIISELHSCQLSFALQIIIIYLRKIALHKSITILWILFYNRTQVSTKLLDWLSKIWLIWNHILIIILSVNRKLLLIISQQLLLLSMYNVVYGFIASRLLIIRCIFIYRMQICRMA